jgi:hypothetical protein
VVFVVNETFVLLSPLLHKYFSVGYKAISKTENKKLPKIFIFAPSAVFKTYGR